MKPAALQMFPEMFIKMANNTNELNRKEHLQYEFLQQNVVSNIFLWDMFLFQLENKQNNAPYNQESFVTVQHNFIIGSKLECYS